MLSLLSPLKLTLLFSLSLLSSIVAALPEDRNQAVSIEADKAKLSQAKGQTIYSGNVKLNQGSLEISADEIIISVSNGILDDLIATGSQASLSQLISLEKPAIHARANIIHYNIGAESLLLEGKAAITQGASNFEGNRIEYLMQEEKVTAEERVRMTLPTPNSTGSHPPL